MHLRSSLKTSWIQTMTERWDCLMPQIGGPWCAIVGPLSNLPFRCWMLTHPYGLLPSSACFQFPCLLKTRDSWCVGSAFPSELQHQVLLTGNCAQSGEEPDSRYQWLNPKSTIYLGILGHPSKLQVIKRAISQTHPIKFWGRLWKRSWGTRKRPKMICCREPKTSFQTIHVMGP